MTEKNLVHTESLKVGDKIIYHTHEKDLEMEIWRISPAGEGGTKVSDGPKIWAIMGPGRYAITFDRGSYLYDKISLPGN